MKYYQTTTEFNCGVDLHSRQMFACVMDRTGKILVSTNIIGNDFAEFLRRVEPYRKDLTVTCECTFNWYWFADACEDAGLKFVLAHALYLKTIHGGKHKNDREDAKELADVLRTNRLPAAYVYPRALRALRTLLRRRLHFVWLRADLLGHLSSGVMVHGHQPVGKVTYHGNKDPWFEKVLGHYQADPLLALAAEADVDIIKSSDGVIRNLETQILKHTRQHHGRDFNLLMTIPGVGEILALTILYEIGSLDRFDRVQDFSSYCRLVKGTVSSGGRILGLKGAKLGNGYLKWAFREAAVLCKRADSPLRAFSQQLEAKKGKHVANAIMASKLGRAAYHMLRDGKAFDPMKFVRDGKV
jgi:transposase